MSCSDSCVAEVFAHQTRRMSACRLSSALKYLHSHTGDRNLGCTASGGHDQGLLHMLILVSDCHLHLDGFVGFVTLDGKVLIHKVVDIPLGGVDQQSANIERDQGIDDDQGGCIAWRNAKALKVWLKSLIIYLGKALGLRRSCSCSASTWLR